MDLSLKMFHLLRHEKNIIYSKLASNPFKDKSNTYSLGTFFIQIMVGKRSVLLITNYNHYAKHYETTLMLTHTLTNKHLHTHSLSHTHTHTHTDSHTHTHTHAQTYTLAHNFFF